MIKITKYSLSTIFLFLLSFGAFSQEICNNGIDDDSDGLIDLNDVADCSCGAVPIPSLIPNPSFEQMNCCPSNYTQVSCASGWAQATSPTSDYMNTCGFVFPAATSAGLLPPHGNGMLGAIFSPGWQEYVGTCLSSPMLAGESYTIEFQVASTPIDNQGNICNGGVVNYGPVNLTMFGLGSCPAFPINTATCPPGWTNLGSVTYTPVASWGVVSITFTPASNINAIILGSPCSLPADYNNPGGCYPYFYFDNLVLNQTVLFNNTITPSGAWCDNNLQLAANPIAGATYQWYLNGVALAGETSLNLDISGGGYGAGDYTLITTVGAQCSSVGYTVTAPATPTASFSSGSACLNDPTTFTDASTVASGSITGWSWDFGDGNTSTAQNPSNTYASTGNYTVTLTVTSDVNCTDVTQQTVTVSPLPTSLFDVSNASGNGDGTYGFCLYDNVNFTDMSSVTSGTVNGWSWDFGDGNTSTLQNPTNLYGAPGTYQVNLIATSDVNCTGTTTIPVIINPQPAADFTFLNDCYYNAANFTDASTISSGNNVLWNWDFGDGNTSTTQNPTNAYASDGIYNVSLIVTSDSGCLDTILYSVERFPAPFANFSSSGMCLNDSICVHDSTTTSSGTITGWAWDFGDGSPIDNNQEPCHLYANYGMQSITLTATSNNNCIDDTTINVMVNPLPQVQFTNTTICENTPPTSFTDQSSIASGTLAGWYWDFGDGNTSTATNPSNTYLTSGVYSVTEVVTSDSGCVDSIAQNVTVLVTPNAYITSDQQSGCIDLCVNFADSSVSNATSITSTSWDFGNSFTATGDSVVTCYTQDGSYDVTLIVSNDLGCYDTIVYASYITAYPLPVADFTITPDDEVIFEPNVTFDNNSIDAVTWQWNFGDNVTDTIEYSPVHVFGDTGLFNIELDVWNQYGCHDSLIQVIYFQNEVIIEIPNIFTPNGDNENDIFHIRATSVTHVEATIFDRWGMAIYNWTGVKAGWDGRTKAGIEASEGTYYYFIEATDIKGEIHKFNGPFNLNR